jgi:hypothetical protein
VTDTRSERTAPIGETQPNAPALQHCTSEEIASSASSCLVVYPSIRNAALNVAPSATDFPVQHRVREVGGPLNALASERSRRTSNQGQPFDIIFPVGVAAFLIVGGSTESM